MKLSEQPCPVNASLALPTVAPSRRAAHRGLPASLYEVGGARLTYRVILLWADVSARQGRREEVIEFASVLKLRDLLARIAATPHRTLLSFRIRAKARPVWCDVTPDFIAWRADEALRRTRERGAR